MDENPISSVEAEAVSPDGAYRFSNTTNDQGAYEGCDHSRPLTGFTFNVIPVNSTTTLTPAIKSDKSYSVDVEHGVTYKIGRVPDVHFYYRNSTAHVQSVAVGKNETALIDYVVVLPYKSGINWS